MPDSVEPRNVRGGTGAEAEGVSAHLPATSSVLAVCAHPDDESFGLGAVLSSWAGARCSHLGRVLHPRRSIDTRSRGH